MENKEIELILREAHIDFHWQNMYSNVWSYYVNNTIRGESVYVITSDTISGRKYQELGIAQGTIVQTVHLGKDIMAGFKTLVGGELTSYNEMMTKARNLAEERMIQNAEQMGGRCDYLYALRF